MEDFRASQNITKENRTEQNRTEQIGDTRTEYVKYHTSYLLFITSSSSSK